MTIQEGSPNHEVVKGKSLGLKGILATAASVVATGVVVGVMTATIYDRVVQNIDPCKFNPSDKIIRTDYQRVVNVFGLDIYKMGEQTTEEMKCSDRHSANWRYAPLFLEDRYVGRLLF